MFIPEYLSGVLAHRKKEILTKLNFHGIFLGSPHAD